MGKNNVKKASGRIGLLLLATVLTFSVLFPVEAHAAASFSDIKGHWAQPYIERAVKQGFIKGYPGGKFEPDKRVTRAEFVSMINRALGNSGTARIAFSDVRYSEWYYSDVAKAVGAAFAAGFNDATFKPNQSITRQEASVMISKVIPTYGYSGKLRTFSDYRSISDWAYTSMSKVNGKGYMTGYSDGKIHPLDSLTRAQAAKIIGDII